MVSGRDGRQVGQTELLEQLADINAQTTSDSVEHVDSCRLFAVLDSAEVGVAHAHHKGKLAQRDAFAFAQRADAFSDLDSSAG